MVEISNSKSSQTSDNERNSICFFFLSGSISDISKIDFSPLGIKCCYYDSFESHEFWEKWSFDESTLRFIHGNLKDFHEALQEREKLFVFLPIEFTMKFQEVNVYQCLNVLLLLFPSLLAFKHMIDFNVVDNKYLKYNNAKDLDFKYSTTGDFDEEFLYFHDDFLEEINSFVAIYAKRINTFKYLKTAMGTYISSFQEINPVMAYLSLCMTLESIVESFSEVTYRICRNVSILISEDKESAETIFGNIQLIFRLRSKIIHGSDYDFEKVIEFLPYLRVVASRMIIEVIMLNIRDIKELDKKLTFAGFGNRESLSNDYKKMTLKSSAYLDSFKIRLGK
jgi:hypothetical protein